MQIVREKEKEIEAHVMPM